MSEIKCKLYSTGVQGEVYLDLAVDKQLLHSLAVSLVQAGVMHADTKGQRQLQVGVPHCGDDRFYLQTIQNTHDYKSVTVPHPLTN